MRKLLLSLLVPITLLTSAPAFASEWRPCGFKPLDQKHQIMSCRRVVLSDTVFRIDWSDGKSDIFIELGDGRVKDSRGGIWIMHWYSMPHTGTFITLTSLSSGMKIAWNTVY